LEGRSLPTAERLITGVHHHQIYRSTVDFSGLEGKAEEAEIPRGFPARKCTTQPDLGARVQKGKKLILFIFACCYWRTWRISSSLILYLGGIFSPTSYLIYIIPDLWIPCMEVSLLSK
jgi:hypothetical protein